VRRVGAAERDGRRRRGGGGGEGRGAQPDAARVRVPGPRQGGGRAGVPGVVSCADILALASRDAVAVIGGPFWRVPTGRRDGRVSIKQEALDQIPAPTMNFTDLLASFRAKGLDVADLVWLSGAHTIGISHCNSFSERLYNFTGCGGPGTRTHL
ncbi:hypothetical protein ZWY2020_006663, partial [Hordeum vulgare]